MTLEQESSGIKTSEAHFNIAIGRSDLKCFFEPLVRDPSTPTETFLLSLVAVLPETEMAASGRIKRKIVKLK